ncbi:PAS domain-containing protein [Mycobacterium hubeiense]|uniref:PAS domain-containing protein n=1 Tax=Mycobacterium hubeiense TaxID=1867256 RepID=UPI00130445A5|nr:PAS domain-containing protein [Mycobacterium sp. QGD 101]
MTHDWLLVETLGSEPAVVARGRQTKNLVPISAFLRRNPHLMAIQTAIAETVRAGQGLSSITPKNDRVIRTEVVQMSDGKIHGVHLWIGPPDMAPPERPIPGALMWDLTRGVATDTPESLYNSGKNPETEATHGRAFADDLPTRDLNESETKVLSMAVKPEPGKALCSTWNVADQNGELITVGFVARTLLEAQDDGTERLICRAMNWRSEQDGPVVAPDHLAQRIINGLAQSGVHRALVDLDNWKLLRWLDEPAPFFDWRAREAGEPMVHPADARHMARMTIEFADGATSGVLRLRSGDGWTPVHMTVNRIELEDDTYAGLVALRLATDEEVAAADLDVDEAASATPAKVLRKAKRAKVKAAKT